jgi:hypothetical protein
MESIDFVKKLISGLAIVCILVGTVMALVGSYSDIFNVSIIGLVLILVGALTMEFMFRKFGSF